MRGSRRRAGSRAASGSGCFEDDEGDREARFEKIREKMTEVANQYRSDLDKVWLGDLRRTLRRQTRLRGALLARHRRAEHVLGHGEHFMDRLAVGDVGAEGDGLFREFVDQFAGDALSRILAESWIIMNTSAREGLPNSMIEAAAAKSKPLIVLSIYFLHYFASTSVLAFRI